MGWFRRAVVISADAGAARAEIEDDFHHFSVLLSHDGRQVLGAMGRAFRHPWTECPFAAGELQALAGLLLTTDPTAAYRHLDPLGQCTHMLEAAALSVTQAARGVGTRRYDVSVSDPADGRCEAELRLDGVPIERWTLQDGAVAEPAERRGLQPTKLRSSILRELPHGEAEVLLIMRRAVLLAGSRGVDIDLFATAAELRRGPACFVLRPGIAERAGRKYGSVRDFSDGPGPLAQAANPEATP